MIRFLSLYAVTRPQWINSSWNNEAKWQHRSGSTLAQVMAHCSMAPNHYLNQCPLIISEVFRASTEGNTVSQELFKISILDMNLKIINLRLQPHLKGGSPILDVYRPHAVSTHNMIIVLIGDCWRKHICKFKPEYLLTDKSTWKYLDKYQVLCLQVQVSTKYFWISKCQVQVSTKYSIFCIKYQVPSTLLDPNPDPRVSGSRSPNDSNTNWQEWINISTKANSPAYPWKGILHGKWYETWELKEIK